MSTPNFASILDKPSSEVERPKPLPVGTYLWAVNGMPRYDKSSKKQTEFVEFTLNCLGAGEDVDQEALAAMGGFQGKQMKATYYLTENSLWRLKEFLDHCGIDPEGSLRQRVEQAAGCQVVGQITHEASQDGQSVFARLGNTAQPE